MTMTAKDLADLYFQLTGKSVKHTSFTKKKLQEMVDKHHPTPGFYTCPHCGIDHYGNGYSYHSYEEDHPHDKYEFVCLACGNEFGPEIEQKPEPTEAFTISQAAEHIGISAKVARARYRQYDNDGKRTQYLFPQTKWQEVIDIISPKRKSK